MIHKNRFSTLAFSKVLDKASHQNGQTMIFRKELTKIRNFVIVLIMTITCNELMSQEILDSNSQDIYEDTKVIFNEILKRNPNIINHSSAQEMIELINQHQVENNNKLRNKILLVLGHTRKQLNDDVTGVILEFALGTSLPTITDLELKSKLISNINKVKRVIYQNSFEGIKNIYYSAAMLTAFNGLNLSSDSGFIFGKIIGITFIVIPRMVAERLIAEERLPHNFRIRSNLAVDSLTYNLSMVSTFLLAAPLALTGAVSGALVLAPIKMMVEKVKARNCRLE